MSVARKLISKRKNRNRTKHNRQSNKRTNRILKGGHVLSRLRSATKKPAAKARSVISGPSNPIWVSQYSSKENFSTSIKNHGIPLHEGFRADRPLQVSARSKNNTRKHLELIKNAMYTTHLDTMNLKPTKDEPYTTFQQKAEAHASNIRKKLNLEEHKKENDPKINEILGFIDRTQMDEQAHYAKLFGPGQITQRHLMNADLYLLETNPNEFITKHNLDKRNLTSNQITNLLSTYRFKAMSEKLQSMTNIAKREDRGVEQNSTKLVNYLTGKLTEKNTQLQSNSKPTKPVSTPASSNTTKSGLAEYFRKRQMVEVRPSNNNVKGLLESES
jgi:hypothetical protein